LKLHASGPGCSEGQEMLFYGRLIGPSLVWVNITREEPPCRYSATFTVFVPGDYRLEIVKEYCGVPWTGDDPDWYADRSFVGELVGSEEAFRVFVTDVNAHRNEHRNEQIEKRQCTADERGQGYWALQNCTTEISYKSATWKWYPKANCEFESFQNSRLNEFKPSQILFIGDSVTRLCADRMKKILPTTWTLKDHQISPHTFVGLDTSGAMPAIESASKGMDVVILNSGLHDYHGRTASKAMPRPYARRLPNWDPEAYKRNLRAAMDSVENGAGSTALKIFRTTTAGWMKWGNYWGDFGGSEVAHIEQKFWTSWHACVMLNRIASEVLAERHGWVVIDGFQPSVSRPDNVIHPGGGAFIHPGFEVMDTLNELILEQIAEFYQKSGFILPPGSSPPQTPPSLPVLDDKERKNPETGLRQQIMAQKKSLNILEQQATHLLKKVAVLEQAVERLESSSNS